MAIGFRVAGSSSNPAGTATFLAFAKPAGVLDGDFLVATVVVAGGTGTTITPPAGWTLVRRVDNGAAIGLAVYTKFALGEPDSWVWTLSPTALATGGVRVYTGVDAFNPIDAEGGQSIASGTGHATPSITTSLPNAVLVASWAGNLGTITYTDPAAYVRRFFNAQTGAGGNVALGADGVAAAAGATSTATATASAGAVACSHVLALRPSGGRSTVGETRDALISLLPPGATDLYDLGNTGSNVYKLIDAMAEAVKRQGIDFVDHLRQEIIPQLAVSKLADWEAVLGITPAVASVKVASTAARQAAVVGKLREFGATTLANVRAAIEPLLGYAAGDLGTLEVVETTRSALTTAHTYQNATGGTITGAGLTQTVNVPDDGEVSAAGVQMIIVLTTAAPDELSFVLTGPSGSRGQAVISWPAGSLKGQESNGVAPVTWYLYGKAAAGKTIGGTWTLEMDTEATNADLTSWSIFVEGAGFDAKNLNGLGGEIFRWSVKADPAKVNSADDEGVRRALVRMKPAFSEVFLTYRMNGGGANAIVDDPNCIVDRCTVG